MTDTARLERGPHAQDRGARNPGSIVRRLIRSVQQVAESRVYAQRVADVPLHYELEQRVRIRRDSLASEPLGKHGFPAHQGDTCYCREGWRRVGRDERIAGYAGRLWERAADRVVRRVEPCVIEDRGLHPGEVRPGAPPRRPLALELHLDPDRLRA